MNSAPAFQFYARDFADGTAHLLPEEVGVYMRLLIHQWSKGGVPTDPRRLKQITGSDEAVICAVLDEFFTICDGDQRRNKRLEAIRDEQAEYRESLSNRGRLGAEKRWGNGRSNSQANGPANGPANSQANGRGYAPPVSNLQSATPTATPTPKQPSKPAKTPGYPIWFEDFWTAYPPNDKGRKRGKAKTHKLIKHFTAEDQQSLVQAAKAYASEADGFVRDPERFVKEDFWRDYLGERERPAGLPAPKKPKPVSAERARYELIKDHKVQAARDWSDDECLTEFRKRMVKKLESIK